jgi:hypothetical protein
MNKYLANTLTLTVLSAALLAAGCGGGSSGPAANVPDVVVPAPVAQRSVSGVASKGTIKKARVQAFALDAQGNKSAAPVASAVTADDGSYTLKIPTTVLTFVVEIDGAAGATMADEASGQEVEFPVDMKLRNVVKLAEANETAVTSHVSPLTELVVKTAETAPGGLTAANIAQSKTGIAAALGFDPEKVKPVNSNTAAAATASPEERMQSLTLAAISKLAQDSKLGCSQPTVPARIACVVKEVAKAGTMSGDKLTLGETLRSEMRQALVAVAANPTINQTGMSSVNGYASFAQGVVPTAAGAPTGIASAKTMFRSLRTNLQAWSDSTKTGGSLSTQFNTVIGDFDKAVEPVDADTLLWVALMSRGLDQLADFKSGVHPEATSEREYANGAHGVCTVYSDEASTVKATSAANALNVACSVGRFSRFERLPTGSTGYSYVKVGTEIAMTPVSGQESAFSYKARAFRETGTANVYLVPVTSNPKTTIGNYGSSTADRATGTLAYAKSGDLYSSFTISGMMPGRFTDAGVAITDNQSWSVNAVRSAVEGGLFNYAFSGDITANKAGVAVGKVTINTGSFARIVEAADGSVGVNSVKEFNLSIAAEAGASKIAGSLNFASFMADANGRNTIPSHVAFTGSMSNSGAQFFSGSLSFDSVGYAQFNGDLPSSPTNFVKLTASLTGSFTVPARPPLLVTASVTNESPTSVTETAQYNDGAVVFNASRVTGGEAAPVISIASTEGVSLKLAGSDNVDVMKDNAKVAVVNVKSGVITYVDGSFESLK